jgi:hypothetical protein
MSIISFFKEAGEKLFGKKAQAAQSEAADPRRSTLPIAKRLLRSRTTLNRWG